MNCIKKIYLIIVMIIVFSISYVTPLMSMTKNNINTDTDNENKKENYEEQFTLYAGVEEIFEELDLELDNSNDNATDNDTDDPIIEETIIHNGWTTTRVNVRKEPNTKSEVLHTLTFNEQIDYQIYNNDWVLVQYDGEPAYIYKQYITQDGNIPEVHFVPNNSGFKSYMPYNAITNKSSKQYKLQQKAYTGDYGIRMVDGRYCVALGTHFQKEIGTYFDLVLKNGTVIKCVLGDIKANKHTKKDNITSLNGCVSEFIVDSNSLVKNAKTSGDISNCNKKWDSPVEKIHFYKLS